MNFKMGRREAEKRQGRFRGLVFRIAVLVPGVDLGFAPVWLRLVLPIFFLYIIPEKFSYSQPENNPGGYEMVTILRLSGNVDFDGSPSEEAWSKIPPLSLIMHSPVFGHKPSESSDIRITYDDNYLYVGAWLMYHDPALIRSASLKRDFIGPGGDFFGIILDTYNDKENGVMFMTTPDALKIDASIQRDAMVSNSNRIPYNLSWNTFWDVKTAISDRGWSAEIRIPVSSLRFQKIDGRVKMGLIIQRWIPSKNEMDIYPAIAPDWGQYSSMKPSRAGEVVFEQIRPQSPFYMTPYLLAGYGRSYVLNSDGNEYVAADDPQFEAGLDVKVGLTSNLIMDLTFNTDFAQVEADDQQINLTRFSLYFPEKRLFFLERSSAFDFSLGGNNNMFYSRRIGLSSDGRPVRIYGGARFVGRLGAWDFGFLDMQTAQYVNNLSDVEEPVNMPSENFGALRLRRQVINNNSYIGSMVTSRLGMNGDYNMVAGLDGLIKVLNNDYLDLKLAKSFDHEIRNLPFRSTARLYSLWERRTTRGIGYALGMNYIGSDYFPGMGFERLRNYGLYRFDLRYGWLPGEKSPLFSHSPLVELRYFYYADNGDLMTFELKTAWEFQAKNKWTGELSAEYKFENLKDTLSFGDGTVYVAPSESSGILYNFDITSPDSKAFYVKTQVEAGSYFDGQRVSLSAQPTWNISRYFEIGATYNFNYLEFPSRQQYLRNHIAGIKALVMVNTRFSFNGFIQFNSSEGTISSNFRLRYNPREGNDLYLVFNEGRNTGLVIETPVLPVYSARSVTLKYSYTFAL
jgi:hypothetical protein